MLFVREASSICGRKGYNNECVYFLRSGQNRLAVQETMCKQGVCEATMKTKPQTSQRSRKAGDTSRTVTYLRVDLLWGIVALQSLCLGAGVALRLGVGSTIYGGLWTLRQAAVFGTRLRLFSVPKLGCSYPLSRGSDRLVREEMREIGDIETRRGLICLRAELLNISRRRQPDQDPWTQLQLQMQLQLHLHPRFRESALSSLESSFKFPLAASRSWNLSEM